MTRAAASWATRLRLFAAASAVALIGGAMVVGLVFWLIIWAVALLEAVLA